MLLLGLILLVGSAIILCFTVDCYSDAPMYSCILGMLGGFILLIVGGVSENAEMARKDCESFRAQGTEAYIVQGSCYVKLAENVFTETRGENKDIESRSWVIGHKDPGQ